MTYGFIGLGNMASAIIGGMRKSSAYEKAEIYGFNRSEGKTLAAKDALGVIPCSCAAEVCEKADVTVLCVKPQMLPEVLDEIRGAAAGKTVVSVAAGKTVAYYEENLPGAHVVRTMPNLAAKICSGVTALCFGSGVTGEEKREAESIFETVGATCVIEEKYFSAFSALGGASAAFACLYIDALAKAGVRAGLPRDISLKVAAQATEGACRLVSDTGEHPASIADSVCSPGGTTIEGVMELRRLGFENAVHAAVDAVIKKDEALR